VLPARIGATISVHHEKLQNGQQREAMRQRWAAMNPPATFQNSDLANSFVLYGRFWFYTEITQGTQLIIDDATHGCRRYDDNHLQRCDLPAMRP
jgi:hypothetical protein